MSGTALSRLAFRDVCQLVGHTECAWGPGGANCGAEHRQFHRDEAEGLMGVKLGLRDVQALPRVSQAGPGAARRCGRGRQARAGVLGRNPGHRGEEGGPGRG